MLEGPLTMDVVKALSALSGIDMAVAQACISEIIKGLSIISMLQNLQHFRSLLC
jgi:hypothetical protein